MADVEPVLKLPEFQPMQFHPTIQRIDDLFVPFEKFYNAMVYRALQHLKPISFLEDAGSKIVDIDGVRYTLRKVFRSYESPDEDRSNSGKEFCIYLNSANNRPLLVSQEFSFSCNGSTQQRQSLSLLAEEYFARSVFNELTRFLREGKIVKI